MVSLIALFVALGGSALAATATIRSNRQVARNTIAGHNPPAGAHANLIAGSVSGADLSADVTAGLTLHCPTGLQRAADICFEPGLRVDQFDNALKTCASLGLRLPSDAELALVFNNSGAPQPDQWVTGRYIDDNGTSLAHQAATLAEGSSRNLLLDFRGWTTTITDYRCVTSATN